MQVLSGQENIPAMEPPAKQPRLHEPCSFRIKLLNENATPPKRGSTLAAGYDMSRCGHSSAEQQQLTAVMLSTVTPCTLLLARSPFIICYLTACDPVLCC